MKTLWTPWRMEYIEGREGRTGTGDGCIFEKGVGAPHDRDGLVLFRDDLAVVLMNRFPYANGHLLVAPASHVPDPGDLSDAEMLAVMNWVRAGVEILRKTVRPDGFNVGLNLGETAGAGLAEHLHFHVVPRWAGDHNFMTVLAEVRTVPEHILATYDRLLPLFQERGQR